VCPCRPSRRLGTGTPSLRGRIGKGFGEIKRVFSLCQGKNRGPENYKTSGAIQNLWCKMAEFRVTCRERRKSLPATGPNCKAAAMLNSSPSATQPTAQDRENRIRAVLDRLRTDADNALRQMAEALVDAPNAQLFGDLELRLRDLGHDIAATARQASLDGRKKRATYFYCVGEGA
jgi:predicted secreted protein